VQIAFRNIGDWGNCLYLDNIQIGSMAQQTELPNEKRTVYPNPLCPGSNINIQGPEFEYVLLRDLNGKTIKKYDGATPLELPEEIKAGTYLLQIHSKTLISNIPLIVVQ
jgi:hypothetical protein